MQKMKSRKGFTLIEMLIVVGIIAILVAVSIPMVNSSLEKARYATDAANERAAKAALMLEYLSDTEGTFMASTGGVPAKPYYDAEAGQMVSAAPTTKGYGRCNEHKDGYIEVTEFKPETGEYTIKWHVGSSLVDGHGSAAEKIGSTSSSGGGAG